MRTWFQNLHDRILGSGLHPDFLKLWIGETISLFGSQVTIVALPLTAVFSLGAGPAQMGVLKAAEFAPFLLLTLFAGVWVDRHAKRPVLIFTNLGRGVLLGLIPLVALLGALRMEHLYAVAFLAGSLTVFFHIAYYSYPPFLVERERLVAANSRLQASASAAEVGGPGIGGLLVERITAPLAIALDALSFFVAAINLALIRKPEPRPLGPRSRVNLPAELGEGFRLVFGNPSLRAIALEAATYNLFSMAIDTVFVLYVTRQLGYGAGALGLIYSIGSAGALLGSFSAERLTRRFGVGPAIVGSMALACAMPLLIPLTAGFPRPVPLLAGFYFLGGIGLAISNVCVITLRQALTPDRLLGRMTACYRTLVYGTLPLGALLGGLLGERIGLIPTLFAGALGLLAAPAWVIFSPLPGMQTAQDARLLAPSADDSAP